MDELRVPPLQASLFLCRSKSFKYLAETLRSSGQIIVSLLLSFILASLTRGGRKEKQRVLGRDADFYRNPWFDCPDMADGSVVLTTDLAFSFSTSSWIPNTTCAVKHGISELVHFIGYSWMNAARVHFLALFFFFLRGDAVRRWRRRRLAALHLPRAATRLRNPGRSRAGDLALLQRLCMF